MNLDNLEQQVKNVLDAAKHGDGEALRDELLGLVLTSDNETLVRLRNAEIQLSFGHFFTGKRTALDTVYVSRPTVADAATSGSFADIVTTYLNDFDTDLETLEASVEAISVAETLASNADDAGVQQLVVQSLTQEGQHDEAWFVSRAHMTRDGVNESLWTIVTESEDVTEAFLPIIDNAFSFANEELAMAINALVPRAGAEA